MELNDTVALMNSADYKDRFVAEYRQVKTRYDRLHRMIIQAEARTLDFTPACPLDLLREQARHMGGYLHCLEVRAEIERIDLSVDLTVPSIKADILVRDPQVAITPCRDNTTKKMAPN